jgi:hypothetical protein
MKAMKTFLRQCIHKNYENNLKVPNHYKPPLYHGLCKNLLSNPRLMCSNLLLRGCEILIKSMEPPFILMVGTMLYDIQYYGMQCLFVLMGMYY